MQSRRLVPMAFVADVPRAIAFYAKLGLAPDTTHTGDGESVPQWAYLSCGDAQLMVAKASDPVIPSQQAILFYIYCDDVDAAHAEVSAAGIDVSAITKPFYAPKGEFRITDPDGYVIMITHV